MAIMLAELYDALKDAGAPDDSARKAAEAVAAHENRFAKIESDLLLLKWMVGFDIAATVGIIMLLLRH